MSVRAGRKQPAPHHSHFAPGKPDLIQSMLLVFAGGFTHSALKRWMSVASTRLLAASYLVRPIAVSWIACWPLPSAILTGPPGESQFEPRSASAICSDVGFLPLLAAIAFSTASLTPSSACVTR